MLALATAGCSEPEQPSTTLPTATSTSAADPTLEPLGPADFPVPAEAREQTEAGAASLTEYYFGLLTYTQGIPVGAPLREFTDSCGDCDSIAESQDQDAANGTSLQGGEFTVVSAVGELTDATHANIAVRVDRSASTVLGADGAEIVGRSGPAATLSGGVLLVWDSARTVWVVNQIDLEAV